MGAEPAPTSTPPPRVRSDGQWERSAFLRERELKRSLLLCNQNFNESVRPMTPLREKVFTEVSLFERKACAFPT